MKVALSCSDLPRDVAAALSVPLVEDTALRRVLQNLVMSISESLAGTEPSPCLGPRNYPDTPLGARGAIEVVLAPNQEAFAVLGAGGDDTEAAFMLSASLLDGADSSSGFATGIRVLALCDEAHFLDFIQWQREQHPHLEGGHFDVSCISSYLCGLSSQIVHAVEFATHGRGMSPAQVDAAYRAGQLDWSVTDILTGRGIRHDMMGEQWDDADQAMEEAQTRSEEEGSEWLVRCLQAQTPASRDLQLSMRALQQNMAAKLDLTPACTAPAPCVA